MVVPHVDSTTPLFPDRGMIAGRDGADSLLWTGHDLPHSLPTPGPAPVHTKRGPCSGVGSSPSVTPVEGQYQRFPTRQSDHIFSFVYRDMHSERMAFVHRDQVRLVHMDSDGFRAKGRRVHRYPYMSLSGISVPPYGANRGSSKVGNLFCLGPMGNLACWGSPQWRVDMGDGSWRDCGR